MQATTANGTTLSGMLLAFATRGTVIVGIVLVTIARLEKIWFAAAWPASASASPKRTVSECP